MGPVDRQEDDLSGATSPVRRGRGRPRDPAVDTKIIDAAAQLLLERGYDNTTVDDVATRAGVGKATVYRRWPSKDDLALASMTELLASEFPEPDTGSIRGDVEASVHRLIAFVNTDQGAAFIRMTVGESLRDSRVAALHRESIERTEDGGRRILGRAIERDEVRPDIHVDLSLQWLSGFLTVRLISGRPMPAMDEVPAIVDWVLYGLTGSRPDSSG